MEHIGDAASFIFVCSFLLWLLLLLLLVVVVGVVAGLGVGVGEAGCMMQKMTPCVMYSVL